MKSSFTTTLFGERVGRVRDLRGFTNRSLIPKDHNPSAAKVVENAGVEEVAAQSESLFGEIRRAFRYKRREIAFACEGAAASIRTPDFEVALTLTQHPELPGNYTFRTGISNLRSIEFARNEVFASIFEPFCDTVELAFPQPVDLEDAIDQIEEVDELAEYLDYDAQCTYLTLTFPKLVLEVRAQQMRFRLPGIGDLLRLLNETESAIEKLTDSDVLFR